MPQHRGNRSREVVGPLSGTLYIPYFSLEINPIEYLKDKGINTARQLFSLPYSRSIITTQSSYGIQTDFSDKSIDYVFIDPPFGSNLQYSELSFIMESWLRIWTDNKCEAVVNQSRHTFLDDYMQLIKNSFTDVQRILKPGRWVTIEFHNSKNSVWTAIQMAIIEAGLVIAEVRTLDKQKGTTKQLTLANTVRQDLIISAYKPSNSFAEKFELEAGTESGVWEFINSHLSQPPIFLERNNQVELIAERFSYLLFDRMVAFHLQKGVTVPISAAEFYAGLNHRFPKRDDMYFMPEQLAKYDRKRMTTREILQLELFVKDESSPVQWVRQQLTRKPQTFKELQPNFMKETKGGWSKHEKTLDLKNDVLDKYFLYYNGQGLIPYQIVNWLEKSSLYRDKINKIKAVNVSNNGLDCNESELLNAAKERYYIPDPEREIDLIKMRETAFLGEFQDYQQSQQKQLKIFRLEVIRSGFAKAWKDKDYSAIVQVGRKIPESVLQEDSKLLMYFDQSVTRAGEDE